MSRRSRRISRWVDDLLHDRRPRRLRGAEQDADVLAAAIELRSVSPGAGLPDPHFIETLRQRVARETQGIVAPARRVSRRRLMATGGLAAATAAAGVIVGERIAGTSTPQLQLVPDAGRWVGVARVADLPEGSAMPFDAGSVRGFIVNRGGQITALSGICTHQGCLLRLNAGAQRLDCPCHTAAFAFDGSVLVKHMPESLPPLPKLNSRIRDGSIEVLTV